MYPIQVDNFAFSKATRVINSNEMQEDSRNMRLSSCISLDLLYIHNGDEPSENSTRFMPNNEIF